MAGHMHGVSPSRTDAATVHEDHLRTIGHLSSSERGGKGETSLLRTTSASSASRTCIAVATVARPKKGTVRPDRSRASGRRSSENLLPLPGRVLHALELLVHLARWSGVGARGVRLCPPVTGLEMGRAWRSRGIHHTRCRSKRLVHRTLRFETG